MHLPNTASECGFMSALTFKTGRCITPPGTVTPLAISRISKLADYIVNGRIYSSVACSFIRNWYLRNLISKPFIFNLHIQFVSWLNVTLQDTYQFGWIPIKIEYLCFKQNFSDIKVHKIYPCVDRYRHPALLSTSVHREKSKYFKSSKKCWKWPLLVAEFFKVTHLSLAG